MLANYHTHTPRCHHAVGAEREYIEKAIKSGFKILGFSDHTPQPYPKDFVSGIRMRMDEIENYTQTLVDLREEYKDQIKILIGYEVEYSVRYFDELFKTLQNHPLDYIIQGQHFAPDEVYGNYMGFPTDSELRLKEYVDLTIEGMKTGLFLYLAHPDLINFTGADTVYLRHMEKIILTSLDLNIPLEINMLGFIEKRNYPCNRFFKLAGSSGVKLVVGCDAHKPDAVKQIDEVEGFADFLNENNIIIGDNQLELIGAVQNQKCN